MCVSKASRSYQQVSMATRPSGRLVRLSGLPVQRRGGVVVN